MFYVKHLTHAHFVRGRTDIIYRGMSVVWGSLRLAPIISPELVYNCFETTAKLVFNYHFNTIHTQSGKKDVGLV